MAFSLDFRWKIPARVRLKSKTTNIVKSINFFTKIYNPFRL